MVELTIPSLDQINNLKVFKKYGKEASITDFSILLGADINDSYYTKEGNTLEDRAGYYWTRTDHGDNDARIVYFTGHGTYDRVDIRDVCVRPSLPYSSISNISENITKIEDGILEVEYGEYPQKAVSKDLQQKLEVLYKNKNLNKTGKTYTTDSRKYDEYYNEYYNEFQTQTHVEYEYNGKKYIRFKDNSYFGSNEFILSNGEKYRDGDYIWVEVSPIKWIVDEKEDIAITKKLIFLGVQFNRERNYKGNFKSTNMYKFLNEIFIKDILPSKIVAEYNEDIIKTKRENLKIALKEYADLVKKFNKNNNPTKFKKELEILEDIEQKVYKICKY